MKILMIISITILLFFFQQVSAQKIGFGSLNQVGLISGSKGESLTLQTINGIKLNKWFTGIGAGLDFYRERTFPLFIDVRRDFSSKKNTAFTYIDGGINFLWLNDAQKVEKQFRSSSPGLFYDLGIGLKLSGKNQRGFIVSAGYSYKQVKEKEKLSWPAPTTQLESDNYQRYNYLYRRIVLKMGFEL